MRYLILPVLLLVFAINSCTNTSTESSNSAAGDSLSLVLDEMMQAHGILGNYQFDFRGNTYSFKFEGETYEYTKRIENDSLLQLDILTNTSFERTVNGEVLDLSQEEQDKYAESLNSVIYFVCLPLKLNDPAVNIELKESTKINATVYDVLEVTFDEAGGGTDHDDIFMYWINQSTHQLDFLAYQYAVSGGGVRFRSAFNSKMVEGMRFQDYVNYGAPVGTALYSLPALFEKDELEKLSEILTENVKAI